MKTLSIIVTVWDRPENLELLLRSLAQQTYRPYLVVIVDYMSKEKNLDLQSRIAGKYCEYIGMNIEYIYHTHEPKMFRLMECYLKAMNYIRSDFIGVFDVDSIFHENYLERVMDIMVQYENIALSTACYILPYPQDVIDGLNKGASLEDMARKDGDDLLLAVGGKADTKYFCTTDNIFPTQFGNYWDGNVFIRTKHAIDYDIFDPKIVGWGNARDSMSKPLLMNGVSLVNVSDIPAFHVAHDKTGNYFEGFKEKIEYMQAKWGDVVLPESNELIKIGG